MLTALQAAQYFIQQSHNPDTQELISNFRLQKLLYYGQGIHLALYEKPLFPEDIEAWVHGPFVKSVYYQFSAYNNLPIPPLSSESQSIDIEILSVLEEVNAVYGQFSSWKLRQMVCSEPPFVNTPFKGIITHKELERYFKTQLVQGENCDKN